MMHIPPKTRASAERLPENGRGVFKDYKLLESEHWTVIKNANSNVTWFDGLNELRPEMFLECYPETASRGYLYLVGEAPMDNPLDADLWDYQARIAISPGDLGDGPRDCRLFVGWGDLGDVQGETSPIDDVNLYHSVLMFSGYDSMNLNSLRYHVRDNNGFWPNAGTGSMGFRAGGQYTSTFAPHYFELVVGVRRSIPYFEVYDRAGNIYRRQQVNIPATAALLNKPLVIGLDAAVTSAIEMHIRYARVYADLSEQNDLGAPV